MILHGQWPVKGACAYLDGVGNIFELKELTFLSGTSFVQALWLHPICSVTVEQGFITILGERVKNPTRAHIKMFSCMDKVLCFTLSQYSRNEAM